MTEILIQTIEGSAIHSWVLTTTWLWPFLEIIHFVGLSLLLGSMLIIDVRLAGYIRNMSIMRTQDLLPMTAIGLLINMVTGLLFLMGDPARYLINIGFQIKMVLILMAGLNALLFALKIKPIMANWDPYGDTNTEAKVIAYISLILWFGVLLLGRLIPYVGTG